MDQLERLLKARRRDKRIMAMYRRMLADPKRPTWGIKAEIARQIGTSRQVVGKVIEKYDERGSKRNGAKDPASP